MIVGDLELAKRLEAFQSHVHVVCGRAIQQLRPDVGATIERFAGGTALFAGVESPLTQAIGVAMDEPINAAELDRLEAFFVDRGAAPLIHTTPWTHPTLLAEVTRRGYGVHEFENCFVRPIAHAAPYDGPIDVQQIGPERAELWARVSAEGFEIDAGIMLPFAYASGARTYLAYIDGEVAGAAAAIVSEDRTIVGLFGASTLPPFRNRGVQTALLQRRLADAAATGGELAFVATVPGSASHRNVARRGFELAYGKVNFRR